MSCLCSLSSALLRAIGAEGNGGTSLGSLIHNFDKTYQQVLASPNQEVAKQITDPEIAVYYNKLLHNVGVRCAAGTCAAV